MTLCCHNYRQSLKQLQIPAHSFPAASSGTKPLITPKGWPHCHSASLAFGWTCFMKSERGGTCCKRGSTPRRKSKSSKAKCQVGYIIFQMQFCLYVNCTLKTSGHSARGHLGLGLALQGCKHTRKLALDRPPETGLRSWVAMEGPTS